MLGNRRSVQISVQDFSEGDTRPVVQAMHNMKTEENAYEQETKRYVNVETGIYRYTANGTYHERPSIAGRRTWRGLGVNFTSQKNLKLAREEYHRRRSLESEGKNPYAEPEEPKTVASTVADVIRKYQADGYLDRDLQPRPRSRSPTRNAIATPCSSSGRPLRLQSSPMPPATNTATGARSGSSRGTGTGQSTAN